jgi:4-amino-4-deoxy-L-arabinose transferase-like glycosyltransferase
VNLFRISSRHFLIVATLAGFGLFFLQGFGAAHYDAPTFDEPLHLTCGYAYLKTGAYWLDSAAPPLARMIAAAPLLFMPLSFPIDHPSWKNHDAFMFAAGLLSYNRIPIGALFLAARSMILLCGLLLAAALAIWTDQTLGRAAATATLVFFATCPPLLAYGHLVTTDFVFTVAFVCALWSFWAFLQKPSDSLRALAAGAAIAAAANSKYSAVCLAVIVPPIFAVEQPWRRIGWRPLLKGFSLIAVAALMLCLPFFARHWSEFRNGIHILRVMTAQGWFTYVWGHYSETGWHWYYLAMLLFKTPALFLLMPLISPWLVKDPASRHFLMRWVLLPAVLYLAFVSISRVNVGVRHILPIYPLLCMAAGAAVGSLWELSPRRRRLAGVVLLLSLGISIGAYPHYIAYFGELAGGSANGYRMLGDSNCDWGQELRALAEYLRQENAGPVYLSYFGGVDPFIYGIHYEAIAPGTNAPLQPDTLLDIAHQSRVLFAISATNRQGIYHRHHDDFLWLDSRTPIKILGHSLFIYDITHDADAHREFARLYQAENLPHRAQQELQWANLVK